MPPHASAGLMRAALVAVLFLLPAFPVAAEAAPRVSLAAGEPDGWRVPLTATVETEGDTDLPVALDLAWSSPDGEAAWTEAWPDARGNATLEGSFVAAHGAGRYEAILRVGDGASAPVVVELDAPAPATASTTVTWDGVSSSAALTLTSDPVNADGKLKSPGEDVVTRFAAEDAGGLEGDLKVEVRAEDGRRVASERLPLPSGTRASLEHRIGLSPLAVGNYTLTVSSDASSIARTFTIKDAAAVVADVEAAPRVRAGRSWDATFVVGDRNLDEAGRAAGALTAKLYRATTAVAWTLRSEAESGAGAVPLDLSGATAEDPTWRVDDGFGTVERVVTVDVPADARLGTYRVAVLRGSEKIGEATFDVVPPPNLTVRVLQARPGGGIGLAGTASGVDVVRVEVAGAAAATREVPVEAGAFAVEVPLPRGVRAGVPLHVRVVGDDVAVEADALVENAPPEAVLEVRHAGASAPRRVLPGARLAVAATADDANGDSTSVRVRLLDADGREVAASVDGALDVPSDLPRGAYTVEAVATDEAGASGSARHGVDVGAWVEAGFVGGEVRARRVGGALEAAAVVANTGNVDVREAVLLVGVLAGAEPVDATLTLADGTEAVVAVEGGRARFDVAWPPGEARVRVRWGEPSADPAERSAPLVLAVRGSDA